MKLVIDDIGALKPTMFCGVPRVFDRVYGGVLSKVSSARLHWCVCVCVRVRVCVCVCVAATAADKQQASSKRTTLLGAS